MPISSALVSVRAVVDAVDQPLWIIDESGEVAHVNSSAAGVLGYSHQRQLVGLPSHDALHSRHVDGSPYLARECPIVNAWSSAVTGSAHEVFLTRSGRPLPVSWTLTPLPLGRHRLLAFSPLRGLQSSQVVKSGTGAIASGLRAQIAREFRSPDLTPERLARENNISLRTLQSIFARERDTPAAAIRRARLRHAEQLVRTGVYSGTVAFECGFRDSDTFARAFRREYGITPRKFAVNAKSP